MAAILIVDNDTVCQLILENILRRNNYTAITVGNGQKAISALVENHIDLVITESMLPGMDDLTFLQYLHAAKKKKNLPVIILTAARAKSWRVQAEQMGNVTILKKPVGSQELLQEIGKSLDLSAPDRKQQDMKLRFGWT